MLTTRPMRLAATLAAVALTAAACGGDDATVAEGDLELITAGTLTICTDAPYAPFEFEDPDAPSGFSGFDIDLVQAMADARDLDLAVVVTGFDAIQGGTALAAGTCDMAASAMTITEEREGNLDFLDPYFDADQSLLSTGDGPQALADVTALGVQADTTGAEYASENFDGEITEFPDAAALSTALQAGNIEAILQDLPVNAEIGQNNDAYTIVETFPTGEQYGFAVAEGATELRDAFNETLSDLRDDGTYDEIFAEYFEA
jgi:polar amino acid transport system substrate-binding protein